MVTRPGEVFSLWTGRLWLSEVNLNEEERAGRKPFSNPGMRRTLLEAENFVTRISFRVLLFGERSRVALADFELSV